MAHSVTWSTNASPGSCACLPICVRTWCSAMIARTFREPTTRWNGASADSKHALVASVAARTGTAISCATVALLPTTTGGNKTQPIINNWSSILPIWILPAGGTCDERPAPLKVSNSSAFAFDTSAKPILPHLRLAGKLLLQRYLCPDGFKQHMDG